MTTSLFGMVISLCAMAAVQGVDNGFTAPPMGWSALYGIPFSGVNETLVKLAAEGMASGGFLDAGYAYVNLDDWYAERNAEGTIIGDPTKFPSGMAALGEAIHDLNLKFGVYSAASQRTCGNWSASMFNEVKDAATFADDWKIDFLKYDSCLYNAGVGSRARYTAMRDALNRTSRQIFYSMEGLAFFPSVGNMARSGNDIWPKWDACILRNLYQTNAVARTVQTGKALGFWLDPDMLQATSPDLSFEEAKSQFVLWAVMKAPLVLGAHYSLFATMKTEMPDYFNLLTHDELIAIDQDPSPMALRKCGTPSVAQQTSPLGVNVTLQACDVSRCDQRWVAGDIPGTVQSAHGKLCLDVTSTGTVFATPCSGSPSQQLAGAVRDSQFHVIRTHDGQCLQDNGQFLERTACIYTGPLPPPLTESFGHQLFVWDDRDGMLIHGSPEQCATLGLPDTVPAGEKYVTSNGTLDHEVWAGPLSSGKNVVVLFNKGLHNETLTASFDLLDVPGGSAATLPVRDVWARKDLGPITGSISAVVPSHGVAVYVVG